MNGTLFDPPGSGDLEAWASIAKQARIDAALYRMSTLSRRRRAGRLESVFGLIRDHGCGYVLKRVEGGATDHLEAAANAQRRAAGLLRNSTEFRVARVVASDGDRGLLLMEQVEGQTARSCIDATDDRTQVDRIMEQCMAWARALHETGTGRVCALADQRVDRRIAFLSNPVRHGQQPVRARGHFLHLADALTTELREMSDVQCRLGPAHLDLNLSNLIIGPDGAITGIDFDVLGSKPVARVQALLALSFLDTCQMPEDRADRLAMLLRAACPGGDPTELRLLELYLMVEVIRFWRKLPVEDAKMAPWMAARLEWFMYLQARFVGGGPKAALAG